MDDNQQFKIPSSPQLGSANQIPESSTESSGYDKYNQKINDYNKLTNSIHNPEVTGFHSADIRAMTDDIHYDQAGYQEALTREINPDFTKPKTVGQLVYEASQTLSNMEESNDWNENLYLRQQIYDVQKLDMNLEPWREFKSNGEEQTINTQPRFGKLFFKSPVVPLKRVASKRELIRHEAQIGGRLFGPIPVGGSRQFFYLDNHTWVWHEEWRNDYGQRQTLTTRYEIRPTGILKAQGEQSYHYVEPTEAKNLIIATKLYYREVMKEVYDQTVNIPIAA